MATVRGEGLAPRVPGIPIDTGRQGERTSHAGGKLFSSFSSSFLLIARQTTTKACGRRGTHDAVHPPPTRAAQPDDTARPHTAVDDAGTRQRQRGAAANDAASVPPLSKRTVTSTRKQQRGCRTDMHKTGTSTGAKLIGPHRRGDPQTRAVTRARPTARHQAGQASRHSGGNGQGVKALPAALQQPTQEAWGPSRAQRQRRWTVPVGRPPRMHMKHHRVTRKSRPPGGHSDRCGDSASTRRHDPLAPGTTDLRRARLARAGQSAPSSRVAATAHGNAL